MYAEKALAFAEKAHAGQADKAGRPYILHPVAVAEMLPGDIQKTVALLHDVVEDTPVTLEALVAAGFPAEVVAAVALLTRRPGQDYTAYIEGIRANPLATAVKIADLRHNMDLSRLPRPTPEDLARREKYRRALALLTGGEA